MKRFFKNILVIQMILLYCFVISIYCGIAPCHATAQSQTQHSPVSQYLAIPISDLLSHSLQQKSFNGNGQGIPFTLKNSLLENALAVRNASRHFFHQLTRYIFYADFLILRFDKPDIAYPFHTFW